MRETLINMFNKENCPSAYTCSNACKYVDSPHCLEERYADHLIENNVIVLPCRKGDIVYQISKICWQTDKCKYEVQKPSREFHEPCEHFGHKHDFYGPTCLYPDLSFHDKWLLEGNCKIICDHCRERFAVQADRFSYGMLEHIYNTPMFDKTLPLESIYFLTKEEAEDVLDKYLKGEWSNA